MLLSPTRRASLRWPTVVIRNVMNSLDTDGKDGDEKQLVMPGDRLSSTWSLKYSGSTLNRAPYGVQPHWRRAATEIHQEIRLIIVLRQTFEGGLQFIFGAKVPIVELLCIFICLEAVCCSR